MKIIKYILLAIIFLVILFFAMGLMNPSIKYGAKITVDKPLEETWEFTQDETHYHKWLEGYQSMELIEGEHNQVGSRYKVIVQPAPDQPEFEMIETIKAIKENDFVTLHFDSDMMDFEQTIYHSFSNGKTTVRSDSEVIGKNLVMRSMFALMETLGGSFTTQEQKNFDALKIALEEG